MTNNSFFVGCNPIHLEEEHLSKLNFLIDQICNDSQLFNDEKNLEQFQQIVKLYGEEPQLLDPALSDLVDSLVKHIEWPLPDQLAVLDNSSIAALDRLRVLSSVRGYKFLMRFLPHEFELLNPILSCLQNLVFKTSSKSSNKNLIQILVIWLMIICKNPFNLTLTEHFNNGGSTTCSDTTFADNIVYCLDVILENETADGGLSVVPTLLAQILTRTPINILSLEKRFSHFEQIFEKFESEKDGGRHLINQLTLANALLKWGRRSDIKPFAEHLFSSLSKEFLLGQCTNILVRDLISKLLQRISLVLLRPKLANWRYSCGHRSIIATLKKEKNSKDDEEHCLQGHVIINSSNNNCEIEQNDDDTLINEEEENIPYDLIEVILGQLLLKLNDRDNFVRWTSAKGIARICARIPLEMAAQVVSSIFKDIFEDKSSQNSGSSWLGGCLVLAELCRRGCLLPEQVPKVISLVLTRSLIFESNQLGFMLAVNIRDASCYICWAFARAYEAKFLRQHLQSLAGTLLSVALFDREVNVRRAASASFQENVGRNNSFPNGIQVLQLIDFGQVARIRHCYLELSVEVAKFSEYIRPMLDHLCNLKCLYWDESIRELASESLKKLAPFDFVYSQNELLPKLIQKLSNSSLDINERHGAFFAVSGLLEALTSQQCQVLEKYSVILFEAINVQALALTDHRKKGFSINAKSICRLIRALCTINCFLDDNQLNNFHNILDIVIGEENVQLSKHAQLAFPSLMKYYKNEKNINKLIDRIKFKYFPEIEKSFKTTELLCCCNIRPLAFLLPEFFGIYFDDENTKLGIVVVQKLINVILDQKTPKWVFARVAAIETLSTFILNSLEKNQDDNFDWKKIFNCLINATDDYTLTTNGNIGRFTRRSAVEAIGKLLPLAYLNNKREENNNVLFPPVEQSLLNLTIGKIIERCCEAIDDLREKASNVLTNIVTIESSHPLRLYISEIELLEKIFILKNCKNSNEFLKIDWLQSKCFERLSLLLNSPVYGYFALAGFIFSAGSVCAWTRENAFLAIVSYIKPFKKDIKFIEEFLNKLILINSNIFELKKLDQSPLLVLFKMLFIDGQFKYLEEINDNSSIFVNFCNKLIFKLATNKGKQKVKFEAISALGSCLLQLPSNCKLYKRSLDLLLSLLKCSPYISIREKVASQLFEYFSNYYLLFCTDEDYEEEKEEAKQINLALDLLSKTDWSKFNIEHINEEEYKNNLLKFLKIEKILKNYF